MNLWLDQGSCLIFEKGNLKLGFCNSDEAETAGTITFLYDSIKEVDAVYQTFEEISTTKPKVNPDYNIYHFWGKDPEGRSLEFQYFLKPGECPEGAENPIEILNPDESKPKLLLTRLIPQNAIDLLSEVFEVHANTAERGLSREELLGAVADKDALLCLLSDKINAELMDKGKKLKVVSNYAVGYNNIDLDAAKERNIAVCNTPGVLTESTADIAWSLVMAAARRIPESEIFLRQGKFTGWEPMLYLGQDVHGQTLGILGMGRIGQAVARRATGFGMRIIYHSRTPKELDFEAELVDFETLLKESDILSLHSPLTPETDGLIGAKELAMMKKSAVLINTARGQIVDEEAMIAALKNGEIFSAGLDVFAQEPFIPDELMQLENVVMLPHIGSASFKTRSDMGELAAKNAIAIVQGEEPPARVI
ncbi:MAG TPA: D-glycerate dehydrogenase [Candidatus Cloacimonetes bacterium]|nr:D-glycerate dehydrogenase [Candidatus Cloacimonadota bacterium]